MLRICFLLLLVSVSDCTKEDGNGKLTDGVVGNHQRVKAEVRDTTGLDGCRFQLHLEDGRILQPLNLDPQFQRDGLKVLIQYKEQSGMASTCMRGTLVNIVTIEKQ